MSGVKLEFLREYLDPVARFLTRMGLGTVEVAALSLILLCITVPWIRIFRRAGYSPSVGLLMFIPPVNIFMFLMFAFHDWPIERETRHSGTASCWNR